MIAGDHIKVTQKFLFKKVYSHHGIYMADGTVIHFTEPFKEESKSKILRTSLSAFARGRRVEVVEYEGFHFHRDITMYLAENSIGREDFGILRNNCEHLASWCKTGVMESRQSKSVVTWATVGSLALPGGMWVRVGRALVLYGAAMMALTQEERSMLLLLQYGMVVEKSDDGNGGVLYAGHDFKGKDASAKMLSKREFDLYLRILAKCQGN